MTLTQHLGQRAIALAVLASASHSITLANPAAADAKIAARVSSTFKAKTGMTADEVARAPMPGFFELVVGTQVFYMDVAGKWLIDGHLVDLEKRTSVTAVKRQVLEAASRPALDWTKLNLADAIKLTNGSQVPGRVLVTFEDPNCGYCKRLAGELAKLRDITVYTYPVSILGEASKTRNESIWCAKDRLHAWKSALAGSEFKSEGSCDLSGLLRNSELASQLKVTGTPTIFLADGSRIPGYVAAEVIEKRLAEVQVAVKAGK